MLTWYRARLSEPAAALDRVVAVTIGPEHTMILKTP